ncbi:MAG TPA: tRNA pseudouridine(55) synthase TruB [Candidatus Krumholzibacteria bacterium]|nr:tRNA pseudouridine(55) synthase TruB [Candidatus Krumholzibacteria bacterium]
MHFDDRVFLIDKPQGLTSFGAVRRLRRAARVQKAGHSGSLDPNATGLLVLCTGVATRLAGLFVDFPKEYEGRVRFGTATDSHDAAGEVIASAPVPALAASQVEEALQRFAGEIDQTPPMVSALKHQGRRLYEIARAGGEVERQPRRVRVHSIALRALGTDYADIHLRCGRGCYVRSIAHDLGQALGVPAHLEALRRTAVGPFALAEASSLEALETALAAAAGTASPPPAGVLALPAALRSFPALTVRAPFEAALRHGAQPELRALVEVPRLSGPHRLLSADGQRLLAMAQVDGKKQWARVRLLRVFPEPVRVDAGGEAA